MQIRISDSARDSDTKNGKSHRSTRQRKRPQDNFNLFDHGICDSYICAEAGRCLQRDLRLDISGPRLWGDFTENKEA